MISDSIANFWSAFRVEAVALTQEPDSRSAAFDRLLDRLQAIDRGLWLEVGSPEPGAAPDAPFELIVTADGKRKLFALVHEVVAAAPTVEGWVIRALKPKLGFPVTTRWEGYTLRIADVFFLPLWRGGTDELGLRLLVRGLDPRQSDDAHNAVLRAMDHGIGEERLAETVHYTEVRPLEDEGAGADIHPLVELDAFIRSLGRSEFLQ